MVSEYFCNPSSGTMTTVGNEIFSRAEWMLSLNKLCLNLKYEEVQATKERQEKIFLGVSTYLSTNRTITSPWSARPSMASFSSLTFCPPPIERPTSPPFHASPVPNTCDRAHCGQVVEPNMNSKLPGGSPAAL